MDSQRWARALRTRGAAVIAIALMAAGLGACVSSSANSGWPTDGCTLKVAILIDRSSSVGDPNYGGSSANAQAIKDATNALLERLSPNGSNRYVQVFIAAFATNVHPIYQPWGGGFADIPATRNPFTGGSIGAAHNAVNNLAFGSSITGYPDDYGSGTGRGRTNWQGAMASVPGGANLVILLTDGDPTWWNGANPANNDEFIQEEDVDKAVNQANDLKAGGTRVVAVHFGQKLNGGPYGGWEARLKAITGPASGSDYFPTDYDGLQWVLNYITNAGAPVCNVTTTTQPPVTITQPPVTIPPPTTTTRTPVVPT